MKFKNDFVYLLVIYNISSALGEESLTNLDFSKQATNTQAQKLETKSHNGNFSKKPSHTKTFVVHRLLKELDLVDWDKDEITCLKATKDLLNGVKNNTLWATWAWNSMQLPSGTFYGNQYHFGNFDQCLKVPWSTKNILKTQYCLVDVKLSDLNNYDGGFVDPYGAADEYIGATFSLGQRLNVLSFGVCLPAVCKTKSITKISRQIFMLSNLPYQDIQVDPRDCQHDNDDVKKSVGYYVFWLILFGMTTVSVCLYGVGVDWNKSKSAVSKFGYCFCMKRNFFSLVHVTEDDLMSVHGVRALTGGFLIVAHVYFLSQFVALHNKMDAIKTLNNINALDIHLDLLVDTFFVMSGLLHMRGLMSSSNLRLINTVIKRYFRLLLPIYFLVLLFTAKVFPHVGSGPIWPRISRSIYEPCNTWWKNIFLYDNKMEDGHCSEVSWSIHTDFHLSIFATVVFMMYSWNKTSGYIITVLMFLISIVIPTAWIYRESLPALLLYDFGESQNISLNKVYATYYKPFWARASSYIVGMTTGYLISLYNPRDYKNSISKAKSMLSFISGLSLLLLCLAIGSKLFYKDIGALSIAFLASIDRSIWAVGICLIIVSCEYGDLQIFKSFLSSKVFVPFSKLTYCNYLIHPIIIIRNIASMRTPITVDAFIMLTLGVGCLVVSYLLSFLLWVFIEAPVTNLISLMFRRNNKTPEVITKRVNHNELVTKSAKQH